MCYSLNMNATCSHANKNTKIALEGLTTAALSNKQLIRACIVHFNMDERVAKINSRGWKTAHKLAHSSSALPSAYNTFPKRVPRYVSSSYDPIFLTQLGVNQLK